MLVAPFAAMIVQLAISRTREYGADRAGAEISGKPHALASALAKLHQRHARVPAAGAQVPALQQLYIFPGLGGGEMFSTHPATESRIAALQDIAAEMGAVLPARAGGSVPVTRRRTSALDPLA